MDKIGYMGIRGSFSEIAAEIFVDRNKMQNVELVPLVCSQNILDAMRAGEVQYGVLGVENSTVGAVSEFVQAFWGVTYDILDEYVLPVHHCLFKRKDVSEEELTHVASHPQAIGQTVLTRAARWPHLIPIEVEDTALAAEWVANGTLSPQTAVICNVNGGRIWDLDMVAENIEDYSENRTKFYLLKL